MRAARGRRPDRRRSSARRGTRPPVVQQPARDVQALAHAPRVTLDPLLLPSGRGRPCRAAPRCVASGAPGRHRTARRNSEGCRAPKPLVRPRRRRRLADPPAHPEASLTTSTEHARPARGRDQQRDQHLDRRRLPGAVRAEQPKSSPFSISNDAAHRLDLEGASADRRRSSSGTSASVRGLDDGRHGGEC